MAVPDVKALPPTCKLSHAHFRFASLNMCFSVRQIMLPYLSIQQQYSGAGIIKPVPTNGSTDYVTCYCMTSSASRKKQTHAFNAESSLVITYKLCAIKRNNQCDVDSRLNVGECQSPSSSLPALSNW